MTSHFRFIPSSSRMCAVSGDCFPGLVSPAKKNNNNISNGYDLAQLVYDL